MKTEFKRDDFENLMQHSARSFSNMAAAANKLLPEIKEAWKAEMLKDAVVVYGKHNGFNLVTSFNESMMISDTHKALLINIEPIFKEPCKHEPSKIIAIINQKEVIGYGPCKYCGVELVAEFKEKK